MSAEELVRAVDAAVQARQGRRTGQEVLFRCPNPDAHNNGDRDPSASWNPEKQVWRCHACGEQGGYVDLARRLGLELPSTGPELVNVYEYRDAESRVSYEVCRYSPKSFKQRRPDGAGGYTWNLNGVERVPYRLPELLEAPCDSRVYVVEGERDADRLASLGLAATTNAGGAGRWLPEFARYFEDRDVVVVGDADDVGRDHAIDVAKSLVAVADTVRVVELPGLQAKGDVSDWLDAGGTAADLDWLVAATRPFEIETEFDSSTLGDGVLTNRKLPFVSAVEFMSKASAEVPWVVRPWVADGSTTMLDGKPKVAGKTTFLLALCKAVVEGNDFLGERTEKSPVVYLTEQGGTSFREGIVRAGLGDCEDFHLVSWGDCAGLSWPEVVEEACKFAHEKGAKLLIVDTLPQFARIPGDAENNAGAALEAMAPLQMAAGSGLAVVVARHERKSGGDVGDSGRGSSAFAGAVDIVLALRRAEGGGLPNVRVIHALSRFDETPDKLTIELSEDGRYTSHGDGEALGSRMARDYLLKVLPDAEGDAMRIDELADGSGMSKAKLHSAAKELHSEGLIGRVGDGVKGSPYLYWNSIRQDSTSKGDE